ncbi:MAG: hypothetical protein ACE5GD_06430 [Candidatus Geothermarchaeales archaeon]
MLKAFMVNIKSKRKEEGILDNIAEVFEGIRAESERGAIIAVEGKNDERILRLLGIKGKIIRYSEMGRIRATNEVEDAWSRKLIILTDFDREGEKILESIERTSHSNGINIDKCLRKRLFEAARPYTSSIEGFERIADRVMNRRAIL